MESFKTVIDDEIVFFKHSNESKLYQHINILEPMNAFTINVEKNNWVSLESYIINNYEHGDINLVDDIFTDVDYLKLRKKREDMNVAKLM